jgi:hypothetical protein
MDFLITLCSPVSSYFCPYYSPNILFSDSLKLLSDLYVRDQFLRLYKIAGIAIVLYILIKMKRREKFLLEVLLVC